MITGNQVRAARALLDLSQPQVAESTGISKNTIYNIEKGGAAVPGGESAFKLQTFFEGNGIDFLPNQGVQFRQDERSYKGRAGIQQFFDDVYETAKSSGGQICLFNGVPHLLVKWLGDEFYEMHSRRMVRIKNNFTFKIIVEEGDNQFIAAGFAEYRWFPRRKFSDQTVYIYGDKVAFFAFTPDSVDISVFSNPKLVKTQRVFFDLAWDAAKVPQ